MRTARNIMQLLSIIAGTLIIIMALATDKVIPALIGVGLMLSQGIAIASEEISENIREEIRNAVATNIAWNSSKTFRKHFEGRVEAAERAAEEAESEEADD